MKLSYSLTRDAEFQRSAKTAFTSSSDRELAAGRFVERFAKFSVFFD
jgi:hypothetical protein